MPQQLVKKRMEWKFGAMLHFYSISSGPIGVHGCLWCNLELFHFPPLTNMLALCQGQSSVAP